MNKFYGRQLEGAPALGMLVLRFFVGMAFMVHGWSKIQKPFGWMGPSGPPGVLQALAAVSEFFGGAAVLLGLLTPLACLGILCVMIGAWYFALRGAPWLSPNPKEKTFELAALYGSLALTLLLCGPGRYSLDAFLFGSKSKNNFKKEFKK